MEARHTHSLARNHSKAQLPNVFSEVKYHTSIKVILIPPQLQAYLTSQGHHFLFFLLCALVSYVLLNATLCLSFVVVIVLLFSVFCLILLTNKKTNGTDENITSLAEVVCTTTKIDSRF